ncbi:MAG: hypothetical protein Q4C01_01030 [Clostridia bacterium]|nr:hypothetical protein [Clostridia bacterium]
MKRTLCYILMLTLLLCGCSQDGQSGNATAEPTTEPVIVVPSTPTPTPTSEPTPTPAPMIYVLAEDEDFEARLLSAFENSTTDTEADSQGRKIAVLQGNSIDSDTVLALLNAEVEVVACSTELLDNSGITVIPYAAKDRAEELFEAMISYPPHDTPVRLLGMFESEDSDFKTLWNSYLEQGKIIVKGVYYATDEEQTPEEWIAAMLDDYVEGMLDGVLCETQAQAEAFCNALTEAERKDTIEVFALEFSGDAESFLPHLSGRVSVDWNSAAESAIATINSLLANEEPSLEPFSNAVIVVEK